MRIPRIVALKDISDLPGNPKILADYQPWFGDPDHIDVGYNSQDPNVLRKQIEKARNMGIYAFVVDWYGPAVPFSIAALRSSSKLPASSTFTSRSCTTKPRMTMDTRRTMPWKRWIWLTRNTSDPSAPGRDAYLLYRGRPVVFVFPEARPHGLEPGTPAGQSVGIAANPAV